MGERRHLDKHRSESDLRTGFAEPEKSKLGHIHRYHQHHQRHKIILNKDAKKPGYQKYFNSQHQKEQELYNPNIEQIHAAEALAASIAKRFLTQIDDIYRDIKSGLKIIDDTHPAHKAIERAEKLLLRCQSTAKQLSLFGSDAELSSTSEAVDLTRLIENLVELIKPLLNEKIELFLSTRSNLSPVKGVVAKLQQILMNICMNAANSMTDGGILKIAVNQKTLEYYREEEEYSSAPPGKYVEISISGISKGCFSDLKAFKDTPFYTKQVDAEGLGMGLSAISEVVKNHKGHLQVLESQAGETAVRIIFPQYDKSEADISQPLEATPTGEEVILVAEDEAMVLSMVQTAFSIHGYKVLAARDGQEALEIFKKQADRIKLAFIDYAMPKLSGDKLLLELRKIKPELPAVLTSGNDDNYSPDFLKHERKGCLFMGKPYPLPKLLSSVRSLIDNSLSEKSVTVGL